jgi:hypothetical protein
MATKPSRPDGADPQALRSALVLAGTLHFEAGERSSAKTRTSGKEFER